MGYLSSSTGQKSSKRLAGLASVGIGLIMALVDQFSGFKVDITIWLTIYGTGMGLLGVSIAEYIGKRKNNITSITPPDDDPPPGKDPEGDQ